MFNWADLGGEHDALLSGQDEATRVSWFATATARLGVTLTPNVLAYVKGGAAWVRDEHTRTTSAGSFLVSKIDSQRLDRWRRAGMAARAQLGRYSSNMITWTSATSGWFQARHFHGGHRPASPNGSGWRELSLHQLALTPVRRKRSTDFGDTWLLLLPELKAVLTPHQRELRRSLRHENETLPLLVVSQGAKSEEDQDFC